MSAKRAPAIDLARFEPDLQALAELSHRPRKKVLAEFDSIRQEKATRAAARGERADAVVAPNIPVPGGSAEEYAARHAIAVLRERLEPGDRERFEKTRERYVPEEARLLPGPVEFDFRPGVLIRQTARGVYWVAVTHDKNGNETEAEYIVITDRIVGHRRIAVEGQVYVEAELLPGQRITATVPAHLARLDSMGRVLDHGRARDVLPALLHHTIKITEESHPTWGFYPGRDGRINECRRPTPIRHEQEARWVAMESAVGREITEDDLRAYADLLTHYRPYEILPILGSAVAAPLAFVARSERELVAHVLLFSKTSGLGKTTAAEAFSEDLFSVRPATGPALNSEFRWPAHLDSVCGPMAVNEAQGLNWKAIAASFKASAESMVADRRGRADQTMDEYMSRLVVLMTSNAAPPLTPTELVRLILVHMDESAKVERERARVAFEAAVGAVRGRAIGPALSRLIVREYPTVAAFMARRSQLATELRAEAAACLFSFDDGRRPGAWAHVYLGIEAFGLACRENGVEVTLPDVGEFLRGVVVPIERGAAEGEVTALQSFRTFVSNYRVEHTVRQVEQSERGVVVGSRDSVKGEGSIIFADAVDLNEGREGAVPRRVPGDLITHPFLDRFNVECDRRSRPELRFASLKELSERAAIEAGLPREAFLEFDKKRGTWRDRRPYFPDGSRPRAAFVPSAEGRLDGVIETFDGQAPAKTVDDWVPHGPVAESRPSVGEDTTGPNDSDVGPVGSQRVLLGPNGSHWVPGGSHEISDENSAFGTQGPKNRPPGPTVGDAEPEAKERA